MLVRRSDLPLQRDATSRFLPWIIAIMVYLAALALAGTMVVGTAVTGWSGQLTGTMTIQIPPHADNDGETESRVRAAVRLLEDTPGVAQVQVLGRGELGELLEPWLGPDVALSGLPLPRLIDVTIDEGAEVDAATLALRLTSEVPDAVVDDHRKWLDELVRLAQSIELLSLLVVFLVSLAAVATVVFAARTGLAIHQTVIEIMHLIGAHDSFVALEFQRQALLLGLRGGLIGLAGAVATVLIVGRVASGVQLLDFSDLSLSPMQWAVLAALPLGAALIAMVTARLTVLRTLSRMP